MIGETYLFADSKLVTIGKILTMLRKIQGMLEAAGRRPTIDTCTGLLEMMGADHHKSDCKSSANAGVAKKPLRLLALL